MISTQTVSNEKNAETKFSTVIPLLWTTPVKFWKQPEHLTSFTEGTSHTEKKASLKIPLIWGYKQENALIVILQQNFMPVHIFLDALNC